MRLKYIETVDFRKSEATNFLELQKKQKWRLGPDEVAVLISLRGNQIVFVHSVGSVDDGRTRKIVRSERLRMLSGSWNPLMLQDYAERVGLHLDGIRRFEQHYKAILSEEV